MDFLQIALIFLILLLSIFLTIGGFYVFLILRDLKKALERLNHVLQTSEEIVQDVERPVAAASNLLSSLGGLVKNEDKSLNESFRKPKPKRFYKKVL